ncbi:MAG: hypothetical protein EXQ59_03855 [Acidobacteria bacterium]|nr:hypothetical protein [Acidobacteriota bacterium]
MSQVTLPEVFTPDEVAQAAGVAPQLVEAMVGSGELRTIHGSGYIAPSDAIRAGRRLRTEAASHVTAPPADIFSATGDAASATERCVGLPAFASSLAHASLLLALLWVTAAPADTASDEAVHEPTHLVFIVSHAPGGDGGGGGLRNPLPPRRAERRGLQRPRVAVPAVTPKPVLTTAWAEEPPEPTPAVAPVQPKVEPAPEPLPSRVLVGPIVAAAPNDADREGVIEKPQTVAGSQGSGAGGGAGSGQGSGNGEGRGLGIGDGSGGGIGGGPFRPGSGIEPPRLLREVKADYTDEGRRRNITGDVVLEIVVRRDGSVGDIRVLQGLG